MEDVIIATIQRLVTIATIHSSKHCIFIEEEGLNFEHLINKTTFITDNCNVKLNLLFN